VKDFIVRAAEVSVGQGDQQFGDKCQVLKEKLDLLLQTLQHEAGSLQQEEAGSLHPEDLQQVAMFVHNFYGVGVCYNTFDSRVKNVKTSQI
jgi:hypothetical protein